MKYSTFLFAIAPCLLVACSAGTQPTVDSLLRNPLYAEQYSDDLVERMVQLTLNNDPVLQDPHMAALVNDTRTTWLETTTEARQKQRTGSQGNFVSVGEPVQGQVLLLGRTLYFGPFFTVAPGVEVHLYLTTVTDPRDQAFPDDTAMDAGALASPYGAQQYSVPGGGDLAAYRTVVLYDAALQRILAFAQLSK